MIFVSFLKEVKRLIFEIAGNSHVFVHQPWINTADGYVTSLNGMLQGVSVYSSLEYRSLAKMENVQVN